ncbi:WD repeat protein [Niveomyces insectorum RCEF 264]|uniref:ASTRA-associated protein 1 n=1 Tax=Niveomyces insectorum RCEF 264 TaxID=1081102 RepID=A0A168A664_9HYPO|nr:WD repeat protein [Niveomyces insectorum RCEF 264]
MAGPAQPTAILRGHRAQVHAAVFVRTESAAALAPALSFAAPPETATADTRLATGDSAGYVVLWDLAIVRPRAVWRAHQNSILGLAGWGADQIVTHGRDHRLIVWQVGVADEARLSTALPLEDESLLSSSSSSSAARPKNDDDDKRRPRPWMLHVLEVSTMNFCAFASCLYAGPATATALSPFGERLVAVPNALTLEAVDLFHLPSQRRVNTVTLGKKEGMIMALALFHRDATTLVLVAAFESGVAVVAVLADGADGPATIRYRAQTHTQPVLSLDVAPDRSYFVTSAADDVVAKHPIAVQPRPPGTVDVPTATPPPATSNDIPPSSSTRPTASLLSAALAQEAAASPPSSLLSSAVPLAARPLPPPAPPSEPETQPLQLVHTKHAGQQGLRIRQDGRIFATAGWDGRVRVYAAKTLKEVAVLKWHQTGCYAVGFAPVGGAAGQAHNTISADTTESKDSGGSKSNEEDNNNNNNNNNNNDDDDKQTSLVSTSRSAREISVKERRLRHAVTAHWLAAGSKDGKVSLWNIF